MKRTLYTEEQIIGILTEQEAGAKWVLSQSFQLVEGRPSLGAPMLRDQQTA